MPTRHIAVLVGSPRKASLNRKLALALAGLAPESLKLGIVEITGLPFYNEEIEAEAPAPWTAFREQVAASDGVLFVTPEYNRSVPALLKNAVDVGSRPYGKSCLTGKPAAVISLSPGAIGGFGANHHLRQSLMCLDVPVMAGPEAYLGNGGSLFDEQGGIAVPGTKDFLGKFIGAYAKWVETILAGRG
ncbi:NADPH-dependent FMN reductase [Derxia gummosa]|uniref:NADPH-dependent FMN reductase n=1 Tax=Derxia gummosa DSM 723 TaxID=1121388 RepID=A0A8B6X694_9BURK|nr:NAD(P)H-dependent oxidoreductase [Derxia gummosa]